MPKDVRFTFELVHTTSDRAPRLADVVNFTLTEGLSEIYCLDVELTSPDPALDFGALLEGEARFTIWQNGKPTRHIHGVISSASQGATGFRRTRYRVRVEPLLARAALRSNWKIFQQKTVPAIAMEILKRSGVVGVEQILHREHLPREYCCQPGETDLDFFERISSEEGFYYAIVSDANSHRLVHSDHLYVQGVTEGGAVAYNATPGGDQALPCITGFTYTEQVRTALQTQRDYTFKNPRYNQQHTYRAPGLANQITEYERYDYPGRYKLDEAGKLFTETRLLSLRRDAQVAHIVGDDARLAPGFAFDLVEHPREEWNTGWRTVRMVHRGRQSTSQEEESADATQGTFYQYEAEIIPDRVEWRPPVIPKPRIDGPQIATVVGPVGEEVFCDEFGRVRVQFPWDRDGKEDEHSSCPVRVSQSWAGQNWGHMAIPRIGQEVVVSFLDGDPDQLLITGRTHPAVNPPPYELPKFHALSPIRSRELKGQRANELRLDDTSKQISAALMSDHGATALHLGYLTHPRPQGGAPRGEGFELRTDERGALRAAKGLLLSTDGQANAQGGQLSRAELIQCLEAALDLARQLGDFAGQHQGVAHDAAPQEQLTHAVRDLGHGANDERGAGGAEPVIALSSPAGIAAGTPKSITLAAGEHVDSVAQKNLQLTAGQAMALNAGQGLGLFAHGGDLRQIAHQGDAWLQSQSGSAHIEAKQSVELFATEDHILAVAKKHITFLCDGAYITLKNGDIEMGCPGTFRVKADTYDMQGAASQTMALPEFDVGDTQRHFAVTMADGVRPVPNQPYSITMNNGDIIKGVTTAAGMTKLLQKDAMHVAHIDLHDVDDATMAQAAYGDPA
ncbi:type VI secretion system tip protein VgrG [Dyella sp. ASV21]|uniref:type VI secretion system tip protein TssI/VgrG n=1 Tax=Dyella sp. ASV21 TaxID=2795114 RepID=UPI0018EC037B